MVSVTVTETDYEIAGYKWEGKIEAQLRNSNGEIISGDNVAEGENDSNASETEDNTGGEINDAADVSPSKRNFTNTVTDSQNQNSSITKDGINSNNYAIVKFTNRYIPCADLKVTKEWVDIPENELPKSIEVQLQKDGQNYERSVKLTAENGWTYTWEKLPIGDMARRFTYTIEEIVPDNKAYETTYQNNEIELKHVDENGFNSGKDNKIIITNELKTGKLMVTKTVKNGIKDDENKDFDFTIALLTKDNQPLSGEYPYEIVSGADADRQGAVTGDETITFEKGKSTITLKYGQSATISKLPMGTTYEITETANNDYTVTEKNAEGIIHDANPSPATTFVNTKKQLLCLSQTLAG